MNDSTWFYLSFASHDDGRFLGATYVEAPDLTSAIARSHELEVNPGGEVMAVGPFPFDLFAQHVAPERRERLLTFEDLGEGATKL